MLRQTLVVLCSGVAAGFHCNVHTGQQRQKVFYKICPQHGFAARKRNAAAPAVCFQPVIAQVFLHNLRQLLRRVTPAQQRKRVVAAHLQARAAGCAAFRVQHMHPFALHQLCLVRPCGANAGAGQAARAKVLVEHQLRRCQVRFRVVAPAAAQRAAFKKHRGAYARPVLQRKTLNVEHRGCFFSRTHGCKSPAARLFSGRQTAPKGRRCARSNRGNPRGVPLLWPNLPAPQR